MANVKIPSDTGAPSQPWDHRARADAYADQAARAGGPLPGENSNQRYGNYGPQVDGQAARPFRLNAGGPHNRPARGHESETR